VAGRAADLVEDLTAFFGGVILPAVAGLK